jgi:hypothetical protein
MAKKNDLPEEQELRWAVEENEGGGGGITTYYDSGRKALNAVKRAAKNPTWGITQVALWEEVCVKVIEIAKEDQPKKYKGHKEKVG